MTFVSKFLLYFTRCRSQKGF